MGNDQSRSSTRPPSITPWTPIYLQDHQGRQPPETLNTSRRAFASDEEREAYEAELCAQVEAEGAALLKNDNNALPLASGAKVSLFGHGSVDLMYGGTGSGSVDTSKAPNFKQALEDQGIPGQQHPVGSVFF